MKLPPSHLVLIATAAAVLLPCAALAQGAAQAPAYHLIDRVSGPDGGWDYASVDKANHRVLVAKDSRVVSIDLANGAVNPAFAPAAHAHGAVAVDGGAQVAVSNGDSNTATFFDAVTGQLLATVPTARGPDALAVDPQTGLLLVAGHAGGAITVIDPKTHAVAGTIAVGGTLEALVADGAGRAYVNVEDKGQVAVVDLKTFKTVARYRPKGCEGPTGLDYDQAGKMLVVACDEVAKILKAGTGAVVASIPTGPGADGDAVYQKEHLAFVSAGENGTLAVIALSGGKPRLVDTVQTQIGARTLAVDQETGRIYLPTAEFGPPAPGAKRPSLVPGSFKVLVVGK